MTHFGRNSILCGDLDYLCLLCDEVLHEESDVQRHVRWEQHRKLVKNITYVSKYRGEYIIMIKNNYFCEICNVILPTTMKTNIHVKEESHINNKGNQAAGNASSPPLVKRNGRSVIISDKIVLTENQWNGIMDGECIICEEIVGENVDEHLHVRSHLVNLLQAKIQSDVAGELYRKVGNSLFYCFYCKELLPMTTFNDHWPSSDHKANKNKHTNKIDAAAGTSNNFSAEFKNNLRKMFDSPKTKPKDAINEIKNKIEEFLKDDIEIDLKKSMAICKRCNFTPAFTVKAIKDHISLHSQAENFINSDDDDDDEAWTDTTSNSEEDDDSSSESSDDDDIVNILLNGQIDFAIIKHKLAMYGKKNDIKLVNDGTKGHCTLCDSYISAHIKNFKQHVNGARHTLASKQKGVPTNKKDKEYKTVALKNYLKSLFFNKHMDDYWINRKLSVDLHSFVGVCLMNNNEKYDKFKCFICNEVFPKNKDTEHCRASKHTDKLFETKVVTSLKREFVREFRPDLFHCGFCNITTPSWVLMQSHLKTYNHRERKEQQQMISDLTHDSYGPLIPHSSSIEADLFLMRIMNRGLL